MQPRNLDALVSTVLYAPLCEARAAKARGQKVVAFMSNNVPVELIHAAGAFALQLPTAPMSALPLADRYLEEVFDPQARSAFELLLQGHFELLDLLILPRSVDSFQRLYYYLCELRRQSWAELPEVYLYDVLQTPWQTSSDYDYTSLLELRDRLQTLTGQGLPEAALRTSIARYNQIRRKLAQLRAAPEQRLTGPRALELFSVSQRMAPERFEALLDLCLDGPADIMRGVPTILIGSAHDTPALHTWIARAGGQVVLDCHWRGDLLFGAVVDEAGEPLRALCDHYQHDSPSNRSYPASDTTVIAQAKQSGARAAVFFYYAQEEALSWDYPAQQAALAALGIASLRLDRQPHPPCESLVATLHDFFAQCAAAVKS
jgi:hypothetical protein